MDKEEKLKVLEVMIVGVNDCLAMMEDSRDAAMKNNTTPRQDDNIMTYHDHMKQILMSACGLLTMRVSNAMGLTEEEFKQAVTDVCEKYGVTDE